jgi:hypothetical protein
MAHLSTFALAFLAKLSHDLDPFYMFNLVLGRGAYPTLLGQLLAAPYLAKPQNLKIVKSENSPI